MSSSRVLQLVRGAPVGLRKGTQGLRGLQLVRNEGAAKQGSGLGIVFPPGPRQFEQGKNWIGSAAVFGATAFTLLCYFSDWKVIVTWIPFYNGKFPDVEVVEKKKK